jgi:hypothetical protein
MKKLFACVCIFLITAALIFVAYINYDTIVGSFGDGPPYYGRSTNMDKWKNPLPVLLLIDLTMLGIAVLTIRWVRKIF